MGARYMKNMLKLSLGHGRSLASGPAPADTAAVERPAAFLETQACFSRSSSGSSDQQVCRAAASWTPSEMSLSVRTHAASGLSSAQSLPPPQRSASPLEWVEAWVQQCESTAACTTRSASATATSRRAQAAPISAALGLLNASPQMPGAQLETELGQLTDEFITGVHTYSLEEVCAWCEICRQLDFHGVPHNQVALADAVRGALDGREFEVEPHQVAAALRLLAGSEQQLSPDAEKEWLSCVLGAVPELSPADLTEVCESANYLALTRYPHLAATLAVAASAAIPACVPEQAVRLAGAALPSALPHNAPERGALLSSMCQHLAAHPAEYEHTTLSKALRLVKTLSAGQPAMQQYVWSLQQLALRDVHAGGLKRQSTSAAPAGAAQQERAVRGGLKRHSTFALPHS